MSNDAKPKNLLDKLWDSHLVQSDGEDADLLYIDLHLVQEVSSPQAFAALRDAARPVRRPDLTLATVDHAIPTTDRLIPVADTQARLQIEALEDNCAFFKIPIFDSASASQGIVHVIGPEQGATLPGMTVVCGDSHTSTHGAFACLAHGIGTSEVEHVLATQTLLMKKRFKPVCYGQLNTQEMSAKEPADLAL
jgi:3-isopropylmalate/(R)-2-methylmalate dehydratase large subunit